jgi:hypothetical protein
MTAILNGDDLSNRFTIYAYMLWFALPEFQVLQCQHCKTDTSKYFRTFLYSTCSYASVGWQRTYHYEGGESQANVNHPFFKSSSFLGTG